MCEAGEGKRGDWDYANTIVKPHLVFHNWPEKW